MDDSKAKPARPTLPDLVRETTRGAVQLIESDASPLVTIDRAALAKEVAANIKVYAVPRDVNDSWAKWDYHFSDPKDPGLTAQYVLVLDALNFCFWPLPRYEYEHLASAIKRVAVKSPNSLSASSLAKLSPATLDAWLMATAPPELKQKSAASPPRIPLIEERARLLREVGSALSSDFDGKALNLVRAAKGSAARLAALTARHFPGFRDHCVFRGRQVFFYKRAQIFAGDVFGAFRGKGLGAFRDIDKLTCFADYRIPQLLQQIGVLRYRDDLARTVADSSSIAPGSEREVAIRAATVQAVEAMREELRKLGKDVTSVQLDWALWERGEALLSSLSPHHRTLTIYY